MVRKTCAALSVCGGLLCLFHSTAVAQEPTTSDQISELKLLLANQQKQIEELRRMLEDQKKMPERVTASTPARLNESFVRVAEREIPAAIPNTAAQAGAAAEAPLQVHIGDATITPVGFMDFTNVWRSTNPGSGIGTNFGSIPFSNTPTGKIAEERMSIQNSRIGARVDADVKGAHVLAYWESDFLGSLNATTNVAVSSNSDPFRLRLYWVDVSKNKFEFLAGQSWSLLTPGRSGISPLPADIFYTQDMDVNYQAGLVWSRDPQLRLVYHANNNVHMALSFENPEQYIGGSSGGSAVTLPSALATPYGSQLNNGGTTLSAPNAMPDIVGKIAFDAKKKFHFELGGVVREFRVWNPTAATHFSATGGAVQANLNFELAPGFRILTNNYWSDGGGRYLFGQAPDLAVRADGSLSPVHSGSTVTGFEFTHKKALFYTYYGGIYIPRDVQIDTTGKPAGYGYAGGSQNRAIQEATFGWIQTFWKDPRYGALSFISQYSYLTRDPWSVATGAPANASTNMLFLDLRYTLPGASPVLPLK